MGTIGTRRVTTATELSKQVRAYKNPTANGFAVTGAAISSTTTISLDITTPGAARTVTTVSGGAGGPVITSLTYLDQDNAASAAVAVSTAGGNLQINGSGFSSTDSVYINNVLATKVFGNSSAMYATVPAGSTGNVTVAVFSTANIGSMSNAMVRYSGAPTWVTSAAISVYNGIAANVALESTSDTAVTYSLKAGSGSLPTGMSLLSSGYLTGTPTGYTQVSVATFTLISTDVEGQGTQRSFTVTILLGDTYFNQTPLLLSATVANTFISDSSTNNFLVSRFGDTRPNRTSPYWPGGWSGYFDGTGDFLSIADSTAIRLGNSDFTIECWFYEIGVVATGAPHLFQINGDSAAWAAVRISLTTSTRTIGLLMTTNTSSWTVNVESTATYNRNQWNHCALVRNGTSIKMYLNGTVIIDTTFSGTLYAGTLNYIGNLQYSSSTWTFNGYISNTRIVKGTALYTANFAPSTTALTTVSNTSLLTLRDPVLADDSPNNFTITRNGDVLLTTFSPFNTTPYTLSASSNSVYFDGTGDWLVTPDLGTTTGDFTVEMWVYLLTPTTTWYPYVFGTNSPWTAGGGIAISMETQTTVVSGTTLVWLVASTSVSLGTFGDFDSKWIHVALVRSGSTVSSYRNGNLTATATKSGTISTTVWNIGGYNESASYKHEMKGYISNFRLIKDSAQYSANFTPTTTALTAIANTSLLTCQDTTIRDNSTNNFAITVNGDARPSTVNPFGETATAIANYSWSANSYSASAYFDGTGDYLTIPYNTAIDTTSSDFTIEAWVYRSVAGAVHNIWSQRSDSPSSGGEFRINSDNTIQVFYTGGSSLTSTGYTVSAGAWSHIATTRSGAVVRLFINGQQVGSSTFSNGTATANTVTGRIGVDNTGSSGMNGYISNFRLLKGRALYTSAFIPPTAPLTTVANTSVLTLQSDIGSNSVQFVDQSPNNHLVTRSGNASQGSFSPLIPSSWSTYFNSGDSVTVPAGAAFAYGTGAFTVEAWVYVPVAPPAAGGLIFAQTVGGINYFMCGVGSTGVPFFIYGTSGGGTGITSPTALPLNTWGHIAWVREGTGTNQFKIYLNGLNTVTGTVAQNFTDTSYTPTIGKYTHADSACNYTGYISNLRVIKGTAQYTANFTPSTSTLTSVTNTSLLTLTGPTLTDAGPNRLAVTRNVNARVTPFGPFAPQTVTPRGYSVYFDGTGDYLTVSGNSAFNFGTGDFTVECWVYISANQTQYAAIICNFNNPDGWFLSFGTSNQVTFSNYNTIAITSSTSISTGGWTHVAVSRSGTSLKMFFNGVQVGSATNSTTYGAAAATNYIGFNNQTHYFSGHISNLRIISGTAQYTANFTPSTTALTSVANTSLLTCHTTSIVDGSTNNFTITVNGDARPTDLNPFGRDVTTGVAYNPLSHGGSVYLDGSTDYLTLPTNTATALGSSNFTIECWIYFTNANDATNHHGIYTNYNPWGANAFYYGKHPSNSGYVTVYIHNISSTVAVLNESSFPPNNSWTHYALVRNGTSLRLYRNGSLSASATVSAGVSFTGTSNSSYIGVVGDLLSTGALQGYMSGFRILVGTAQYTTPFVPPTAPALPTTANTSLLLNFTSSGVVDSTGRTVLETVGDARVATSTYKYGSGSLYFDGTGDYLQINQNNSTLLFGTGEFTIEFWFNTTSSTQYAQLIGNEATNGFTILINDGSSTDGKIAVYNGASGQIHITTGSYRDGAWYHLALTRNSTGSRLFINGVQQGSTNAGQASTTFDAGTFRWAVGANIQNAGRDYIGYIDDLRITKGYARYTANFSVPTDTFVSI